MAVEEITLNEQKVATLKELLRPGLKAVFVGLNPSPKSVGSGHFYQGHHGRCFWNQLYRYRILPPLPRAGEDDAAFALGYGFADLVRRPTQSGSRLTRSEKSAAVDDLIARLATTGDRPCIVFRYREPWGLASDRLIQQDYRVLKMPSPYASKESADTAMKVIQNELGTV